MTVAPSTEIPILTDEVFLTGDQAKSIPIGSTVDDFEPPPIVGQRVPRDIEDIPLEVMEIVRNCFLAEMDNFDVIKDLKESGWNIDLDTMDMLCGLWGSRKVEPMSIPVEEEDEEDGIKSWPLAMYHSVIALSVAAVLITWMTR